MDKELEEKLKGLNLRRFEVAMEALKKFEGDAVPDLSDMEQAVFIAGFYNGWIYGAANGFKKWM